MKKVVFTILAAALFVLAWTFYIKYDTHRFLANLSEVPPHQESVAISDATLIAEAPKPTRKAANASPVSPRVVQTPASTDDLKEMSAGAAPVLPLRVSKSTGIDETSRSKDVEKEAAVSSVDSGMPPGFKKLCESCSASRQNWRSLSKDQLHEYRRQDLIKRFGDIPEVHIFMDTGKRMQEGSVSPETALEFAEAVATLFPNPANEIPVKELRELLAKQRRTSADPKEH